MRVLRFDVRNGNVIVRLILQEIFKYSTVERVSDESLQYGIVKFFVLEKTFEFAATFVDSFVGKED